MTAPERSPGRAASPLLHWLALVCGLALVTALRIDTVERMVPLWVGGVLGTVLGQVFAWARLRPWVAAFLGANAIWMGALVLWPLFGGHGEGGSAVQAYVPAMACGYLSMTERGTLAGFWFPAVLWTLAILEVDPNGAAAVGSTAGWLVLGGLGTLLLATLWTREARRVAQWTARGTVRLALPGGRAVLREAPVRGPARVGWMVTVAAATIAVASYIAPHLRQHQSSASVRASGAAASHEPSDGLWNADVSPACCPAVAEVEVERERVQEYFDLTPAHDIASRPHPPPPAGRAAMVCRASVSRAGPPVREATTARGSCSRAATRRHHRSVALRGPVVASPGAAPGPAPRTPSPTKPPASPPSRVEKPPAAAPSPLIHPSGVEPSPTTSPPRSASGRAVPVPSSPRPARVAEPEESHLFEWLLAISASALGIHFGLRPVRRWITLRHLRRPFGTDTVDQRVSNLWQLVLVGLRDAGWRTLPGEQPQELARRVGIDGMQTCAAVLERARHGVRVDGADLDAMVGAAWSAYRGARRRAGWLARIAAWWRWPLV